MLSRAISTAIHIIVTDILTALYGHVQCLLGVSVDTHEQRERRCALVMQELTVEPTEVQVDSSTAPVLLTPTLIEKMLARRQALQVVKFRTTCTDCVPNL
jgi:hypothetical protein